MSTQPDQSAPSTAARRGGKPYYVHPAVAEVPNLFAQLSRPDESWERIKKNASRTVYRGQLGGETIYLKHFHSRTLTHRTLASMGLTGPARELTLSLHLNAHNVETPTVLAAHWAYGNQWVATRAVEPAEPLDIWHEHQAMLDNNQAKLRKVTVKLGELVGHMHAAGMLHGDLHCGNVLIRTDPQGDLDLVLTDLHRAKRCKRLSRRRRATNLAQLFHDRYTLTNRTERTRFLKHYLRASGDRHSVRGWQILIEAAAHRHTRRQHCQRDRRVKGCNKYFHRLSLADGWRGHVVLSSKRKLAGSPVAQMEFTPEQWQTVLADPTALLEATDGARIAKDSRSSRVVRRQITLGEHRLDVFIKQARRKYWWKAIIDCFRPSRALRAFGLGHALLTRRIPTALPLAALEQRRGLFLKDNILITEAINWPRLDDFLMTFLAGVHRNGVQLTAQQQHRLGRDVLWQMGRMLQRLHDNNFAHRDLKAANMFVRWELNHQPQLVLVDLDGLRQVRSITSRQRFQGLMRLNVSLLKCPAVNHAGQLRMLMGYLRRPGTGRVNFKPYWRVLERWSAEKLRQQIRSRQNAQRTRRLRADRNE
jgi:tRNA A-37 threonylcarbamoyl transferase component Bud32